MKQVIIFTIGLIALIAFLNAGSFAQPHRQGKSPVETMDTDGDGKISKDEWIAFHEKMFKDMDKNEDEYLVDDELRPPRGRKNNED